MMTDNKKVLELGYFIGEPNGTDEENFEMLQALLESGTILPDRWETVNEEGEVISVLDGVLGQCEFASFVEIPQDSIEWWQTSGFGIGFTPEFLEKQEVDAVTYVPLDADLPRLDAGTMVESGLEYIWDNWDELRYYRHIASGAISAVRNDPEKRAYVHEMIAGYANDTRTFYEIVPTDDLDALENGDILREWRGTSTIHFTLDDVQTIYVPSLDHVMTLRIMHPSYKGTYVVLDNRGMDCANA